MCLIYYEQNLDLLFAPVGVFLIIRMMQVTNFVVRSKKNLEHKMIDEQ